MEFTWDRARLQVRFADGVIGIFDHADGALAASATGESQPAELGLIPTEVAGSLSGECAGWIWAAGRRGATEALRPVRPGAGWVTVTDSNYWLACGPRSDAPSSWELQPIT